jgi:FkbM family methyltransferase
VKALVKKYLFGIIATTYFQPLFRKIHRFSLWGMNIGLGGGVEDSGESYALKWFAQNLHPSITPVILDIGANKGQFASMSLKIIGSKAKIYSFEPSQVTFNHLEQNLNGYSNVKIYNFGLGQSNDQLTLYSNESTSGCASLYQRNISGNVMQLMEKVEIKTLDSFCEQNSINYIHYLKLDVEGHELDVLKGAKNMLLAEAIESIQFEFGGCNIDSRTYFRDFFELLSPKYDIYRLVRNGFVPINSYHETLEIFTTTNFLAISKIICH